MSRHLDWLVGPAPRSLVDEDGRPLGERASPLYGRCEVIEERRTFGDLRDPTGLPCNIAALRQLAKGWPALMEGLSSFAMEEPADHHRLLRRLEAACDVGPLRARLGAALDRASAGLHKLCLGYREVVVAGLYEERFDADAPVDRDALLGWLDERPFLVGDHQVCAGTRAQIRLAFEALLRDRPARPLAILRAAWLPPAVDAVLAAHAVHAAGAGAARALLDAGRLPEGPSRALSILHDPQPSRYVEALRHTEGAGPAHASLLFRADGVPPALRAMLDAVLGRGDALTFADIDAALETALETLEDDLARAMRDATP